MSKLAAAFRAVFLVVCAALFTVSVSRAMPVSAIGPTKPSSHSVNLTWKASNSPDVVGYNVYRGSTPNGPFKKINDSPVPKATYTDKSVAANTTYYYTTTAVDSKGKESGYSEIIKAVVP